MARSAPLDRVAGAHAEETRRALDAFLSAWTAETGEYLRGAWREDEHTLTRRAEAIRGALTGAEHPLLNDTLRALGLDPLGSVRIELVPVAPPPGAVTYRTGDGPVSVVGERDLDDDTLLEVALHEAIHGFDSQMTGEREDVLAQLRDGLREAGLDERDPRFRGAWHALFFVHAAEMVRRDGRPEYVDYGERSGVYAKTGPVVGVLRALWPQVLEGDVSRGAFIRSVVDAIK
ncbi:MAG: hypothetical protein IPJ41_00700 [Phycisphaerales bacterium]|nr:hypothetical protein [Phycisphaerales bacterium]